MKFGAVEITLYVIRGLLLLLFLAFGWRELTLLLRRPANNMGRGVSRVWAVGRTTFFEAWAGRVWLLPLMWLAASIVMIFTVRPFDESERIPLYIRTLLSGQEILLLVMLWVMACVSLPRERERKTLVTNASKPLSRLEIVLGKMAGFSATAALLLLVMGLCSAAILYYSDYRLRVASGEAYKIQLEDFSKRGGSGDTKAGAAPSAALKRLSEEGSLFAYNYITVPKDGMSIVGEIDLSQSPPVRYIKGGSAQKITYRFAPNLVADDITQFAPYGSGPYFVFSYNVIPTQDPPPSKVEIQVSAVARGVRGGAPPQAQGRVLTLKSGGYAGWEPEHPEWFLSYRGDRSGEPNNAGEVSVDVQCTTPGVLLEVREGADPDPVTGAVVPAPYNVAFVADRTKPGTGVPHRAGPVVHGFERRERQEVAGPKAGELVGEKRAYAPETAVFRFAGKDLKNVPVEKKADGKSYFKVSMLLDTYMSEHPEAPTFAMLRVLTMDTRLMTVDVPEEFLGNPDPANRGDMIVMVSCITQGHSVSVIEDSVRIEKPASRFIVNLFKSEVVIFLEAVLLIAISVTCSVRVGWPVAMLCSTAVFTFGYFVEFIKTLPNLGGLTALNYYGGPQTGQAYAFFDLLTLWLWRLLAAIASFVPDFTIFKPDAFIMKLQNMPWLTLGSLTLSTALFILPVIAIAYLLFRKQELG